jgi:hypothetical protein
LCGTPASRHKGARLMLHACFIEFPDPDTGDLLSVASEPPF